MTLIVEVEASPLAQTGRRSNRLMPLHVDRKDPRSHGVEEHEHDYERTDAGKIPALTGENGASNPVVNTATEASPLAQGEVNS